MLRTWKRCDLDFVVRATRRSYHSAINSNVTFLTGDGREVLRTLPEKFVHCCVTRPPYCGLRSYTGEPGMMG